MSTESTGEALENAGESQNAKRLSETVRFYSPETKLLQENVPSAESGASRGLLPKRVWSGLVEHLPDGSREREISRYSQCSRAVPRRGNWCQTIFIAFAASVEPSGLEGSPCGKMIPIKHDTVVNTLACLMCPGKQECSAGIFEQSISSIDARQTHWAGPTRWSGNT